MGGFASVVVVTVLAGCGRIAFDASPLHDAALDAGNSIACPTYPLAFGTSRYRRTTDLPKSWFDAELACESDGTHLVIVDDPGEDVWLGTQADNFHDVWIGLTDHLAEAGYHWIDGTTLSTPHWQGAEPNNLNNAEDCVESFTDGTWNDTLCTDLNWYVCECDGLAPATPPTWCDTSQPANCGACGVTCPGTCQAQQCQ